MTKTFKRAALAWQLPDAVASTDKLANKQPTITHIKNQAKAVRLAILEKFIVT